MGKQVLVESIYINGAAYSFSEPISTMIIAQAKKP